MERLTSTDTSECVAPGAGEGSEGGGGGALAFMQHCTHGLAQSGPHAMLQSSLDTDPAPHIAPRRQPREPRGRSGR